MTNTKDKYTELKSTDIDQWALNIVNKFEAWRFSRTQSQAKAKSQVLIASLLANLDAANSEWISVEDRLPDEDRTYLCFHVAWGLEIIGFYQGRFHPIGLGDERPTHWMPLPNPPTDKGGSQ